VDGALSGDARLGAAVLEEARHRLVKGFPGQVRACLDRLTDEQVWRRAHAESNAVGNLVLHVCGSNRHHIGRLVGGADYERNRKAEFAERGPLPRAELLRILEETVEETDRILRGLDSARLLEMRDVPREAPHSVLALVVRSSHHWAVHTGQIVYATKLLTQGSLDELWMKTMI
jgi:uncharacterized damage-inducible protein DinB